MAVKIGHASIAETGSINGNKGDQTGKEVCIREWYSKPWSFVLRPIDELTAKRTVKACIDGCNNPMIGYGQNDRNTLHSEAIKVGYDLSRISTPCNCDCSSFMTICAIAGGVTGLEYQGNAPITSTMDSHFVNTGKYIKLYDSKYLTSDTYLKAGDILVKPGSHTVMVLEDGKGGELMRGIDISKWQKNDINFEEAKRAGYDFVILRIGYDQTKDTYFESNYRKAREADMLVGAYFYSIRTTENDLINDAHRVLGWLANKKLDLPVACDLEEQTMKLANRKDINSRMYNAFSKVIKDAGYRCMLYTGENMFNNYFNKELIYDPLWIAKYSINKPNVGKEIAIWQYTSDALIYDFYKAKLDRNEMFISLTELMKERKPISSSSVYSQDTYTQDDFIRDACRILKVTTVQQALSVAPTISIKENKYHPLVTPLERYMKALGYYTGSIEADKGKKQEFGPGMDKAIKTYQEKVVKHTEKNIDGELTKNGKTYKTLFKLI